MEGERAREHLQYSTVNVNFQKNSTLPYYVHNIEFTLSVTQQAQTLVPFRLFMQNSL